MLPSCYAYELDGQCERVVHNYHIVAMCLKLLVTCLGMHISWFKLPSLLLGTRALAAYLQVLVSLQAMVFVPDPYFNEPGFESSMRTAHGQQASRAYNQSIR